MPDRNFRLNDGGIKIVDRVRAKAKTKDRKSTVAVMITTYEQLAKKAKLANIILIMLKRGDEFLIKRNRTGKLHNATPTVEKLMQRLHETVR